jgi:serine/threonine protein kinase
MADSQPDREKDDTGGRAPDGGGLPSVVGRIIGGNFRVLKLIGTGAMGHVYQAEQLSLGKMVALKLLRRELQGDEKLIRRFELEAKNASSLNHPNSIQIIDFGREGDLLFIAMELLPGVDLGQLILREGPLPLGRLGRIMDQVLAALDEAHAHGIVHRDLKPGNIMLTSRRDDPDFVKVCDFGIAKAQSAPEGAEALTLKGLVCGTPEYMSPEQARGEDVDGRSDLYSVGVILYQLVTGELPFTASSPVGILSKHLAEMPLPPTIRRPGLSIPPGLEAVILHALAKEPGDRPASAEQLRAALRGALAQLPPSETLTAPVHRDPRIPPTFDILSAQVTTPMGLAAARSPARAADSRVGFYRSPGLAHPPPRRRFWLGASLLALLAVGVWLVFAPGPIAGWLGTSRAKPVSNVVLPPAVAPAARALVQAASAAPPAAAPAAEPAPEIVTPVRARERRGSKPAGRTPAPARAEARQADPVSPPEDAPVQVETHALSAPLLRATASPMREAERLLAQGEVAAACDQGEEQLRAGPSAAVYKFLGKCYMRLGKPDQAKAHYRRYLELSPDASDAAFIRSIVNR